MIDGKTVSVVLATYREKDSVRRVINEFFDTGLVDEVLVVNNNAEPGTEEEVAQTKATRLYEKRQGYGYTYRTGIAAATGDFIVLCEPDGTYTARDLEKFLAYGKDFPAVFGTRTNTSMIAPNSDMTPFRRFGNVVYGKLLCIIFGAAPLTDIGCTYKLFRKEALRTIEPYFKSVTPLFATELVVLTQTFKIPFVEIPVHYDSRMGQSTIISHWYKLFLWAWKILKFFVVFRLTFKK